MIISTCFQTDRSSFSWFLPCLQIRIWINWTQRGLLELGQKNHAALEIGSSYHFRRRQETLHWQPKLQCSKHRVIVVTKNPAVCWLTISEGNQRQTRFAHYVWKSSIAIKHRLYLLNNIPALICSSPPPSHRFLLPDVEATLNVFQPIQIRGRFALLLAANRLLLTLLRRES
jgi:hypothetical protein